MAKRPVRGEIAGYNLIVSKNHFWSLEFLHLNSQLSTTEKLNFELSVQLQKKLYSNLFMDSLLFLLSKN